MPLEFVGACLGRASTISLKMALKQLGFDKVHHMIECILVDSPSADLWVEAFRLRREGDKAGCKRILRNLAENFSGMIDYPSACFWREYHEMYPDLPVLLTVRDWGGPR